MSPLSPPLLPSLGAWDVSLGGAQSALAPAGEGAEQIAALFWIMAAGAALIWVGMVALTLYVTFRPPEPQGRGAARAFILGGGVLFPTVVLGLLLFWGLSILPGLLAPAPPGSLSIEITGEQWWWRIRYLREDGAPIELANELHLPLGERVDLHLTSADVVHSLWIPALGGKMDMLPGRQSRLTLHPTRPGRFRGVCAEFCGGAHAQMAFAVVVEERSFFEAWLRGQARDAQAPSAPLARRGAQAFLAHGCGACHTLRGTGAEGRIGPDLTHVGGRLTLGAGASPVDAASLARFIRDPQDLKPATLMPAFGGLPAADIEAMGAYLEGLE